MRRWTTGVLWLSCAAAVALALRAYFVSPPVVPIHFGPSGLPDRWGSRLELLIVLCSVSGLSTALFFALPRSLRLAPRSMFNLPNKEYWLAPERHEAAESKLTLWADAVGVAVNLLLTGLQLVLAPPYAPTPLPAILVVVFVVFVLGACGWLAWAYRLPPGGGSAE